MTTRFANRSDASDIIALGTRISENDPFVVVDGFDPITGVRLIKASLEEETNPSRILVAENNGQLVGFAFCRRHPPPQRCKVLQLDLAVDNSQRRLGFGNALINHAVTWAVKTNIHRIQLAVVADNEPAISLYKKHQFIVEGTLRESFCLNDRTYDVLVMARLLS